MKVMETYEIVDIPEIERPGIYAIHNKCNNKYYIGSAINLYHRLSQHWCEIRCCQGINLKMDHELNSIEDIQKLEYIIIEIFENGEITNADLKKLEDAYIKEFEAVKKGYNSRSESGPGNVPMGEKCISKQYMTKHRKECVIQMYVPKGMKEVYKARAAQDGIRLNTLINKLLEEYMKKSPD